MAVEADAVGHAKCGRLADVVQQRACSASVSVGCVQLSSSMQRVRPDVAFRMEFRRLRDAFHGGDLGQDVAQQAASSSNSKPRRAPPSVRMRAISSRTRSGETCRIRPCQPLDGGEGGRFDVEAQPRRETHGAEQPQMVFLKAALPDRRWRGSRRARRSSRPPAKSSTSSVSGSSSSALIVKSRRSTSCRGSVSKCTAVGTAAVAIARVAAERGDLHLGGILAHQHHAEMRAHLRRTLGKSSLTRSGRASVATSKSLGRAAQQQVAHAAAYQKRLVARGAQPRDDRSS